MTSVLTDEERRALVPEPKTFGACQSPWAESDYVILQAVVKAAEAAVIRKLAAGVSVEPKPDGYDPMSDQYLYKHDKFTTAIAAARVQENERCVQVCAAKSKEYLARSNRDQHSHGAGLGAAICAELLSALLGKEIT